MRPITKMQNPKMAVKTDQAWKLLEITTTPHRIMQAALLSTVI